jgi:hypothetical protein
MQVTLRYYNSEIYKPTVTGHGARSGQEMHIEF